MNTNTILFNEIIWETFSADPKDIPNHVPVMVKLTVSNEDMEMLHEDEDHLFEILWDKFHHTATSIEAYYCKNGQEKKTIIFQ